MIFWTMLESVFRVAQDGEAPFLTMFSLLFGESLAGFLGLLLSAFLGFHIYLSVNAMTTIEFLEKQNPDKSKSVSFSRGLMGDAKAVLGDNIWLWFLPVSPPSGDGMSFVVLAATESTPLRFAE